MLGPGCTTPHRADLVQLTNADFELPLDSGWTVSCDTGRYSTVTVFRSDTLDQPEPGFAVHVSAAYTTSRDASISQTTPIETLAQVLRFWAKFRTASDTSEAYSSEVTLSYLSSSGARLGRTSVIRKSARRDLRCSDSVHVIPVTDTSGQWIPYALNLQAELDSWLPRVDQASIRRLRVELRAGVYWSPS